MIQRAIGDCISYRLPRIAILVNFIPIPDLYELIGWHLYEFDPLFWFQEQLLNLHDYHKQIRELKIEIASCPHPLIEAYRRRVAQHWDDILTEIRYNGHPLPTNMRQFLIFIEE